MLTAEMGKVLPEQPEGTVLMRVLNLGCGAGDWLIDMAKGVATSASFVGVGSKQKMVEYARRLAQAQHVYDRAHFRTMDVLSTLAFEADAFDLANQQLGHSYVRIWE